MEKKSRYQLEAEEFNQAFAQYKDKRIVLYGIGRRTASLVPALPDYRFVGLMDRDPENIGRIIYGLPVLSCEEAEEKADLLIINAPATYWQVIYRRIMEIKLPVFFTDGQRAYLEEAADDYSAEPYWDLSLQTLEEKLGEYDVISFDIFDTLIMRKTYVPQDVFAIVDTRLREETGLDIDFIRLRYQSAAGGPESDLEEIYEAAGKQEALSSQMLSRMKDMELEAEESVIIPREELVSACRRAAEMEKEIYLLSDMYLPKDFLQKILKKAGVEIDQDHLWVSGSRGESKSAGDMWRTFKEEIVGERRALHIGDDPVGDMEAPSRQGIDAFLAWGGGEILKKSSISPIVHHIDTLFERNVMGLLTAKLFHNPFSLHESRGKVYFSNFRLMGYCVWGPVIYTFLAWLLKNAVEAGVEDLLFFARDGYLLEADYKYLTDKLGVAAPRGKYLNISRRAIAVAAVNGREDFEEILKFPYNGTFRDYMKDRFDVCVSRETEEINGQQVNPIAETDRLREWIKPYEKQIIENIKSEKQSYEKYFKSLHVSGKFAVVDTGYWGTLQNNLSRLLDKKFTGYYFYLNQTEENKFRENNLMIPCFQAASDKRAAGSNLYKKLELVESMLTAPHGMVLRIDEKGNCVYDIEKGNQRHFGERIEMNKGVRDFIDDILTNTGTHRLDKISVSPLFVDRLFGLWFDGHSDFSAEIKAGFFWDNGMVQKREMKIFE